MADQVNAITVDIKALFHIVNDRTDVRTVIDLGAEEVAAGIRGIPEPVLGSASLLHAVRRDEQKAVVVCQVTHLEVAVLVLAAGSVAV